MQLKTTALRRLMFLHSISTAWAERVTWSTSARSGWWCQTVSNQLKGYEIVIGNDHPEYALKEQVPVFETAA
jgi:hypothetical protein